MLRNTSFNLPAAIPNDPSNLLPQHFGGNVAFLGPRPEKPGHETKLSHLRPSSIRLHVLYHDRDCLSLGHIRFLNAACLWEHGTGALEITLLATPHASWRQDSDMIVGLKL